MNLAVVEDVEEVEEEEEIEDVEEEDDVSPEIEGLRRQIAEISARAMAKEQVEPEPESIKTPQMDPKSFLTPDLHERILEDPSKLNGVLNEVYRQAVETVIGQVKELEPRMVASVSRAAQKEVQTTIPMYMQVQDFFRKNEDLVPYRKLVQVMSEEISQEKPNLTVDEMLAETESAVRKSLALAEKTKKKDTPKKRPSFAKGTKGKAPSEKKVTGSEARMLELLDKFGPDS